MRSFQLQITCRILYNEYSRTSYALMHCSCKCRHISIVAVACLHHSMPLDDCSCLPYDLQGSKGTDCIHVYFCGPCALAQEAQELQSMSGRSMARE